MPREVSIDLLHPVFRRTVAELRLRLALEMLPIEIYESSRSPYRQAELYAIGRTTHERGHTRTKAMAWSSFHQYGFAVDMVWRTAGQWSWEEPHAGAWKLYQGMAHDLGLRTLSFERPHVELPLKLVDLQAGRFPEGGDDTWRNHLEHQAEQWGAASRVVHDLTHPGAPPEMLTVGDRPPIES